MVIPHLAKLSRHLDADGLAREFLELIDTSLKTLTTSQSCLMEGEFQAFTATEVEIAQLVKRGKTTKKIADTLSRAASAIEFHRNNIRVRLSLRQGQNLRTYLRSVG